MNYSLVSDSWGIEEKNAIKAVIKSNIYTYKGKYVKEFENKFARFFHCKYSVMVNSGSSANLISIASLFYKKKNPLKKGDEVIVPTLSWSTTYYPLQQYGLKLRFVDIDIDTLNASVQNIIKAYTKKTKLIVAVNILGNPIELSKLRSFCRSKKIYLMEDNCESMGAKINFKKTPDTSKNKTNYVFETPKITTCGIEGVLRNKVINHLRKHGKYIKTINIDKSRLRRYKHCFITNSVQGLIFIDQIGKKKFQKPDSLYSICLLYTSDAGAGWDTRWRKHKKNFIG